MEWRIEDSICYFITPRTPGNVKRWRLLNGYERQRHTTILNLCLKGYRGSYRRIIFLANASILLKKFFQIALLTQVSRKYILNEDLVYAIVKWNFSSSSLNQMGRNWRMYLSQRVLWKGGDSDRWRLMG